VAPSALFSRAVPPEWPIRPVNVVQAYSRWEPDAPRGRGRDASGVGMPIGGKRSGISNEGVFRLSPRFVCTFRAVDVYCFITSLTCIVRKRAALFAKKTARNGGARRSRCCVRSISRPLPLPAAYPSGVAPAVSERCPQATRRSVRYVIACSATAAALTAARMLRTGDQHDGREP
jgi:hypothetical protein